MKLLSSLGLGAALALGACSSETNGSLVPHTTISTPTAELPAGTSSTIIYNADALRELDLIREELRTRFSNPSASFMLGLNVGMYAECENVEGHDRVEQAFIDLAQDDQIMSQAEIIQGIEQSKLLEAPLIGRYCVALEDSVSG